jgi:hypothetical protein
LILELGASVLDKVASGTAVVLGDTVTLSAGAIATSLVLEPILELKVEKRTRMLLILLLLLLLPPISSIGESFCDSDFCCFCSCDGDLSERCLLALACVNDGPAARLAPGEVVRAVAEDPSTTTTVPLPVALVLRTLALLSLVSEGDFEASTAVFEVSRVLFLDGACVCLGSDTFADVILGVSLDGREPGGIFASTDTLEGVAAG